MNTAEQYIGAKDTDTHRVCGACNELKPVEEFYRDGLTKTGEVRYRRDCKACYKTTRKLEKEMKNRKTKGRL